jgi:uncharacterized C2H2 Zn-finger protein
MHRICPFLRVAPSQILGENPVIPEAMIMKIIREVCARCLLEGYHVIGNGHYVNTDEEAPRPPKRRRKSSTGGQGSSNQAAVIDPKDNEHKCIWDGCNAVFNRNGHLSRHVKTVHLKIKDVKCYVASCGQVFSRRDNMTQHCTLTHGATIEGTLKGEAFIQALQGSLAEVGEELAQCYLVPDDTV